jgi:hypothetical protein
MGRRCAPTRQKAGQGEYRLMEVVVVKKSPGGESVWTQVMSIDNHYDTLQTVRENLAEFIDNMVRIKFIAASKDAGKTDLPKNNRTVAASQGSE